MKRALLFVLTLICAASAQHLVAQADFKLEQTDYVGALSCDPAMDWTAGWTNFDPENTAYPDPTDMNTLNGMDAALPVPGEKNITNTLTLDPAKVYLLRGFIVVRAGGKLVIPAGTIIRGQADLNSNPKNYGSIVVERGGQIAVMGTKDKPVVFTSSQPVGQRHPGDFGGLLLAGRSLNNGSIAPDYNYQMEGFNNVTFDPDMAHFGGDDVNDNSGEIHYLRIEFGGVAFEINKEINAFTFGAVGAGTLIDHLQSSFSNDDSYEWFGGTMRSRYLIAYKGADDDFDTDYGYSGVSQFGIGIRDSANYDPTYSLPSGGSTSEGFESDNEATGTANVKPHTAGVFSNFTMVGPVPVGSQWSDMNATTKAAFRRGARIRRNSALRIVNSIFMGYRNFLMIDGDSCVRNTNSPVALSLVTPSTPVDVESQQISFANNLIVNTNSAYNNAGDTTANGFVEVARGAGCQAKLNALNDFFREGGPLANNIDPVPFMPSTVLVNPISASKNPDFRPVSPSPALSGANFTSNPTLANFTLDPTTYVGALSADPDQDWTTGWTNFDPQNTNYPDPTDVTTLNGMDPTLPVPGELNIPSGATLTLDPAKVYFLTGFIVVRDGGKLVIPAGTIIRAQADLNSNPKNYGSIIVERGGKIEILGTEDNPVVMTSSQPAGLRNRGDFGGLLIAGRSLNNGSIPPDYHYQMEGFNNVTFDPDLAYFGGDDVNDNSGEVHYLRIEFGGVAFEINKEINAFTFGAVGGGTQFDHLQASFSNDDSFEWFGGTMKSKYLIAFKGTDDDFDTDYGYSGVSQFGIGIRDSAYYDLTYPLPSGGSTSEGFESDNEATGTANVKPHTSGVFSNYTMVGPVPVGSKWSDMNSTTKAAFRRGARIRRNSALRIVNSIFMGYRNFLMIDGDSCVRNTNCPAALALVSPSTPVDVTTQQISFANNLIVNTADAYNNTADTTANGFLEVTRGTGCEAKLNALTNWFKAGGVLANNIDPVSFTPGTVLINPMAASKAPNFRPVGSSPACSGANFADNPVLENLITASHEIEVANLSPVYPNPITNGDLNFGHEVVSYGIFNISGSLISNGFNTDHANINGIPPGIYFIKLEGRVQKFIIQ